MSYSFDKKSIFISGGCGSLGSALVERLLRTKADRVVVFDNNQSKLSEMERQLPDSRLRFFVGDVRDESRLRHGLEGCDVAFHCAALKIIPSCEYNPMEAIKTNVLGSENFIEACLETVPEIAVGTSTDKACSPLNLYGATKLCMERLFIAANRYKGSRKTIFTCVRYGNVFGSAESVIPVWLEQAEKHGRITITDPEMTRFSITMNQALDFIFVSMNNARGSEVFIPKLKSYTVKDLASAFVSTYPKKVVMEVTRARIGEKNHETLINEHEIKFASELAFGYAINQGDAQVPPPGVGMSVRGSYSSSGAERLTIEELVDLINKEAPLQLPSSSS